MKILEFDLGNTRLKWRLLEDAEVINRGAAFYAEASKVITDNMQRPDLVRIACVAGSEKLDVIKTLVSSHCGVAEKNVRVAQVVPACAGVVQGYTDLSRLGVDRWLAMLAVHNDVNKPAEAGSIVVNCGTAITVDLLRPDGQHLGGYIVPGMQLMRESLFSGTNAVKLDSLYYPDQLAPGRLTQSAVENGLPLMVKGLVEQARLQLAALVPRQRVVMSGGDGLFLHRYIDDAVFAPELVLDGLVYALPVNS